MVSLFNGISIKAILLEEQQWYYLTHSWEDKGVHTFPMGICPKVNVIMRLEYKLAYGIIIGFYLRALSICTEKILNDEFDYIENSFTQLQNPKSFMLK